MNTVQHTGLRDLRDKIKEVMIPLLVSVFESKLAAQTQPSRLQKQEIESPEKILHSLEELQKDVNLLFLWCHSCKMQIGKAIEEIKQGPTPSFHDYKISSHKTHPDLQKSFKGALGGTGSKIQRRSFFLRLKDKWKKIVS